MGYAIRITTRAVEVVSGADSTPGLVAAEASGVKVGLRAKWGGGELRARTLSGRMVRQGNGWVLEGNGSSPYGSYTPTPVSASFPTPGSPYAQSPTSVPGSAPPPPQSAVSPGFPSSTFGPGTPGMNGHHGHVRTPSLLGGGGPPRTPRTGVLHTNGTTPPPLSASPGEQLGTPSYGFFPPTPNPAHSNGGFVQQQQQNGLGGVKGGKKDD